MLRSNSLLGRCCHLAIWIPSPNVSTFLELKKSPPLSIPRDGLLDLPDKIHHRLPETAIGHSQLLRHRLPVQPVRRRHLLPTLIIARHGLPRPLKLLLDDIRRQLVRERLPRRRHVPLPAGRRVQQRLHMRLRQIPDVNPRGDPRRRKRIRPRRDAPQRRVGLVQPRDVRHGVHDGAEDHGRAERDEVELWLLALDELPRLELRELLGPAVGDDGAGRGVDGLFVGERVPVRAGVGEFRARGLGDVDDGGEGGGQHDAGDLASRFGGGGEDGFDPVDGGDDEFLFVVGRVVGAWLLRRDI